MAWYFQPPQYELKPVNTHRLLTFYEFPNSFSVIKYVDGTYQTILSPSITQYNDPSTAFIYQGGHVYEITAEEAAALQAAGYQPYEEN